MVFGQPGSGGADEIRELGRYGVEDGGSNSYTVKPEVPCCHEAPEIAEGSASPDVEAALEWHLTIEIDDRDGHGEIEEDHGGDPSQSLGPAEPGSNSHPRAADHAEDLREDKVAEAELTLETIGADCRRRLFLGHGSGMVAQRGGSAVVFLEGRSKKSAKARFRRS